MLTLGRQFADVTVNLTDHEILFNQRNIGNPVADMAALCRFYRSSITGTLEPAGTSVWLHGALVLQSQDFKEFVPMTRGRGTKLSPKR